MLSYDSPGHLNGGQSPTSPASLTAGMAAAVSSKTQPSVPGVPTMSVQGRDIDGDLDTKFHHIWLVTGPAGCGKTTVAEHIAKTFKLPYVEGDNFHPKANIDKMSQGIPLTDADRWDWLTLLREESQNQLASGADGVVLTCSALKRKYRDVIRVAAYYDHSLLIHFIFLNADESVLVERVAARSAATNHYMGANMVSSQFSILEVPQADERDVVILDVSKDIAEVKKDAINSVNAIINNEENVMESR